MSNIKYTVVDKNASSFGGLHVVSEFLDGIKFDKRFIDVFSNYRRIRKYNPYDVIKMLLAVIFSGGDKLSDIDRLKFDPVIPYLFGNGNVPEDTTIRNDLKYIGKSDDERQELLFIFTENLINYYKPTIMTLDMDGTSTHVEGHQTNAKKGYCPEAKGKSCFQHLIASWDEMDLPIAIVTHPGNTHCSNGADDLMRIVLNRLTKQVNLLIVRDDSGFYSENMLELFESYSNVEYEVMSTKLDKIAMKIEDTCFRRYHNSENEYAVIEYQMNQGKMRTYYIERITINDVPNLFNEKEYKYRIIVSNRKNKQPHTIFNEYNDRAHQEQLICECKNEFALGSIVSNDFSITKAAAWVSMVACAIIAMIRKIAFRLEYKHFRMKKLRYYLFSIVAVFVNHSREKVLNLYSPYIGENRYNNLIQRIKAFS